MRGRRLLILFRLGVNHVAHFLLFQLLKPTLLASSTPEFPSRVVSVSSFGHRSGSVRLKDYNFQEAGSYNPFLSYGQAKTANIWLANEIGECKILDEFIKMKYANTSSYLRAQIRLARLTFHIPTSRWYCKWIAGACSRDDGGD